MKKIAQWLEQFNNFEKKAILSFGAVAVFALFLGFLLLVQLSIESIYRPLKVDPVLKITPDKIVSIQIQLIGKINQEKPVKQKVILRDSVIIEKFCGMLHIATKFDPNHPKSIWKCLVTITTDSLNYSFVLFRCEKVKSNGMLMEFYSNKTWGVRSGFYRADGLGYLVEEITPFLNDML